MDVKHVTHSWNWARDCEDKTLIRELRQNNEKVLVNLTQSIPERSRETIRVVYKILECLWWTLDPKNLSEIRNFFTFIQTHKLLVYDEQLSLLARIKNRWESTYSKDHVLSDFCTQIMKSTHATEAQDRFISEIVKCMDQFTLSPKQRFLNFSLIKSLNKAEGSLRHDPSKFPLHHAINLGLHLTLSELVTKCSLVEQTDPNGNTPLHIASKKTHQHCFAIVCRTLINMMNDLNVINNKGETVLYSFCKNDHQCDNIAKIILSKGANLQISNHKGRTALEAAIKKDHFKIASLILDKLEEQALKSQSARELVQAFDNSLEIVIEKYRSDHKLWSENPTLQDLGLRLIRLGASVSIQKKKWLLPLASKMVPEDFNRLFAKCDELGITPLHHSSLLKYINDFELPIDLANLKNCDGVSPLDLKDYRALSSNCIQQIHEAKSASSNFESRNIEIRKNRALERLKWFQKFIVADEERREFNTNLIVYGTFIYNLVALGKLFEELLKDILSQDPIELMVLALLEVVIDRLAAANIHAQLDTLHAEKLPIRIDYFGLGYPTSDNQLLYCAFRSSRYTKLQQTHFLDDTWIKIGKPTFISMAITFAFVLNLKRNLPKEKEVFKVVSTLLKEQDLPAYKASVSMSQLREIFDSTEFYRDIGLVISHTFVVDRLKKRIPEEVEALIHDRFKALMRFLQLSRVFSNL